ncbi:MAG TPA: hypothetical protein ENN99_16755 [Chloroflexi bacterium]|nr:hypothetical protein [Chloroflexota bacterium]
MNEWHPREVELARFSDGGQCTVDLSIEEREGIEAHLRWCTRCRNLAVEYGWLQRAMTASLADVADSVVAPTPTWCRVRGRILALERRQSLGIRLSAVAGVMLVVCQMLMSTPVWEATVGGRGGRIHQTDPPRVVVATAPLVSTGFDLWTTWATPTPIVRGARGAQPTPAPALLPTPPESGL